MSRPTPSARNLCLFDLDGTLLPIDSDHAFGEFMMRIGWADGERFRARNDEFFAAYLAGTLNQADYVEFATSAWRTRTLAEAEAARERFMREVMAPSLRTEAIALVEQHRQQGDLIAIVTATNEFVTAPIAQAFGVGHLIATRLERDERGAFSGRIAGVPAYREGKVARVHDWLASMNAALADFGRISVYSDSPNDLPLLELATDAVATNAGAALQSIARERGWRILQLFQ
jgi:HAD superfamily hydrolase (TIGR01490 family)